MDSNTRKAAAFEIAKRIDTETFDKFKQKTGGPKLGDLPEALIDTHLPGWLIYYVNEEREEISNFPMKLVAFVDDEDIQQIAERYLEYDGPVIDLSNPISQNWMSEDPKKPFREELNRRRQTAVNEIILAIEKGFTDVEEFKDEDFVDWFASGIVKNTGMLQWDILRKQAESEGFEDPNRRVAEGLISGTNLTSVALSVASYFESIGNDTKETRDYIATLKECDTREELNAYENMVGARPPRADFEG